MPLYEYQCDACGERFERIQKFSDLPVTVCPTCGGAVRRLISSPAIQFKGSGWYITDYAKSGAKGEKAGSKDDGAKATGDAAAESKPAEAGTETPGPAPKPAASSKT